MIWLIAANPKRYFRKKKSLKFFIESNTQTTVFFYTIPNAIIDEFTKFKLWFIIFFKACNQNLVNNSYPKHSCHPLWIGNGVGCSALKTLKIKSRQLKCINPLVLENSLSQRFCSCCIQSYCRRNCRNSRERLVVFIWLIYRRLNGGNIRSLISMTVYAFRLSPEFAREEPG